LLKLEKAPGVPLGDVGWLRLRCDDTLGYSGEYQLASIRQLQKDVAAFVEEFPGVLPPDLADEVVRMGV
jgi:hypothetical protein